MLQEIACKIEQSCRCFCIPLEVRENEYVWYSYYNLESFQEGFYISIKSELETWGSAYILSIDNKLFNVQAFKCYLEHPETMFVLNEDKWIELECVVDKSTKLESHIVVTENCEIEMEHFLVENS